MIARLEKWKKKLSGDRRKILYDIQKPEMVRKEAQATADLVKIEKEIKQLIGQQPVILIPYYIIFGKEIYKRQKKFKAETLNNEVRILEQKWESRGLNTITLEKIKAFYVHTFQKYIPFRFNISFLDGQNRLS